MNQRNSPEMSVVIVTPDDYQVIRRTIRFLRAQTVKDRLELVIGAPSGKQLGLIESDLEGFHSYKVVEVGEIRILTDAKVAAVAESSAPIVAFAEDHCYPEPDWAEALIASHRRGHAAVGPLMRNANPATSLSWAGLFLHYGCCIQPVLSGQCTNLPWHNLHTSADCFWSMDLNCLRCLLLRESCSMTCARKATPPFRTRSADAIM